MQQKLHERVMATVRSVREAALVEEVSADLADWAGEQSCRSGYYPRITDTQYRLYVWGLPFCTTFKWRCT